MPSATLPPVTAATTSQPSHTSAVKQFHSAKPEPVVFQIDDQSFPPLPSATLPPVSADTTSQPSYTSAVKQFHLAKPEPVVFQIDDQSFPPLPSATLPPVTPATTSQPSYTSAVKQFHSAKPEPVVFQIDDQSFPPLPSATLPPVTAATTSQPSHTSAVMQFHSAIPEPVVFQIDDQSIPPLPSANTFVYQLLHHLIRVPLNLVGRGCEDNAVLYTIRRDYLKPLDKPDTTKISTIPPIKPKAGELYVINGEHQNDWACDGYKWVNKGRYGLPKNNPIVFVRCYNISRHLNDNKCSDDFKRRLYYAQNSSLKLVHYVGDETAYIPQPHGKDRNENPRQYRRTLPSTITDIRNKGTDKQPNKICKELVVNRPVPGMYQGVKNPRNTEQVRNQHRLLRKEKPMLKNGHIHFR